MEEFSRLLARARAGDRDALGLLWVRHEGVVKQTIRFKFPPVLRARYDPADLAQSVFGEVLRALPRFEDRGEDAFRRWLRLMARNKVRQKLRMVLGAGGSRRVEPLLSDPPDRTALDAAIDRASREERRAILARNLVVLDRTSRRILALRFAEGLDFRAIAVRLSLPSADAARKQGRRAMDFLARRMPDAL